jgi:hypothetical protein
MPAPAFNPYADDAASMSVGELTIENGQDRVAVYGQLDLTRDKAGLKLAHELKAVLDAAVHHLEAAHDLPEQVPAPEKPRTARTNETAFW